MNARRHGRGATVRLLQLSIAVLLVNTSGCHVNDPAPPPEQPTTMPQRDINAVLRDHDDELLAIPGVVGVFVGLLDDGKTPCLKVMAEKKTAAMLQRIPSELEGYRVVVEETGKIRPLQ